MNLIGRIKQISQIKKREIQTYFKEDAWKRFLNRFLEAVDEDETFTIEFKKTWQTFMVECLERMIVEIVGSKKLIEIKDLNRLTIGYDVYDITNTLRLNDKEFKALIQKELDKEKLEENVQESDN